MYRDDEIITVSMFHKVRSQAKRTSPHVEVLPPPPLHHATAATAAATTATPPERPSTPPPTARTP
ncbi:hypothetical protein [Scytonema sp. PCC 10023]|uniref:hypothetical protein n=1 Tax=Scytonema sp. PCC 10023 TaxID=1680591 RepID=UPI0039C66B30